ncbi:hypothetical protein [Ornithinimicrobium sp. CNJ-824]|uniref:hypothetical protein n=1 Tax=Ornithinimicrobium sp. CNJ-824 TaxID=1904966 RepID=UPI00267C6EB1
MPRTDVRPDFSGLTYVPPGEPVDPDTQYSTYQGPVPMVVHLHGAMGMGDESDGYPEAWYLPDAWDLGEHAEHGTWYEFFARRSLQRYGEMWRRGEQVAHYPNDNRDSTLWFHDHTLGITRLNVYAGPAGFYLLRGGPHGEDEVTDARTGRRAVLPAKAPASARGRGRVPTYELPLAIQDRSFNADGSLFYPDTRAFFDGYEGPYVPDSPIHPVWNPEFFGNTLIVNGRTWPFHEVEQRRYRLRLLNGCGSRFLILDLSGIPGVRAHQIGNDGGFLPAPHDLAQDGLRLLMAPAERADVILDLTDVPVGEHVITNLGPDEPYGGGEPGVDFDPADPTTTGRVMQLRVVPATGRDRTTPAEHLQLPGLPADGTAVRTRKLALLEHMHAVDDHEVEEGEAPAAALLGVMRPHEGKGLEAHPLTWADPVTENPDVGDTEEWEIYNLTADAHPVHVHETPVPGPGAAGDHGGGGRVRHRRRRPAAGPARRPRPEGHGHLLSGHDDADPDDLPQPRPVRLALPRARARGQRDDAALPGRPGAEGAAGGRDAAPLTAVARPARPASTPSRPSRPRRSAPRAPSGPGPRAGPAAPGPGRARPGTR